MRFAYADPPYFGCGKSHYGERHPNAADFDIVSVIPPVSVVAPLTLWTPHD